MVLESIRVVNVVLLGLLAEAGVMVPVSLPVASVVLLSSVSVISNVVIDSVSKKDVVVLV